MATTEFIAAIELGSSKIAGVAGRKNNDGSMHILAYAREDSSAFIRKGVIFNLDKTAQSLTSIINKLEGELHNKIAKVYVCIGGQSLHTVRNIVSRNLENDTLISEELISAICDENIAIPVVDMDILDVAPQEYKIGNNLQTNPVGMKGSHIEGRFLNLVARSSIRKNLEYCFDKARLDIADILIAPLVTANAVLTENERRSGCALVDIGADTTTVSVYKNNILRYLNVIPLGGNSITHDITTLRMEEEDAEQLKINYGDVLYEEPNNETPATCTLPGDDSRTIELAQLNNIVEARAEEITANIWYQIQLSGYEEKLLSGIVITGGTSNLKNLDEMLQKQSKKEKIRVAKHPHKNLIAREGALLNDGTQNTLLGMLFEGDQNCCEVPEQPQAPAHLFDNDPQFTNEEKPAASDDKDKNNTKEKSKEKSNNNGNKSNENTQEKPTPKPKKTNWLQWKIREFSESLFSEDEMK